MSRRNRKDDPLDRMQAANPVSAAELGDTVTDEELSRAMQRAIAAGESPAQPVPVGDRAAIEHAAPRGSRTGGLFSRSRTAKIGLSVGLACVAAVAALIVFAGGSVGGGSQPAFAAAAIAVAEANPRLLVTAPGWSVSRADEFEADSGEITFGNGDRHLSVVWYPARFYGDYLRDRATVSTATRSTLLGRVATTVHYGRGEYATMLAPEGPVFVEMRGRMGSKASYESVLHSVRPVDVETWLAAMPASVVKPEDQAAAIEAALRGVPLPPGFDTAAIENENAVRDQYQFAVAVTGAVACGWVESWLGAQRGGDEETMANAVETMATWSSWPALQGREMRRGWAINIEQAANRIKHDKINDGPVTFEVRPNGPDVAIGPQWSYALGCKPHYRRVVENWETYGR